MRKEPVMESLLYGTQRREMKRRARQNLKRHYLIFIFICLIAAAIGAEFRGELEFMNLNSSQIQTTRSFLASFGREGFAADSRGVLAQAVNRLSDRTLAGIIDDAVRSLAGTNELLLSLGILCSSLIFTALCILFVDPFVVAIRRPFLEGRVYERVGLHRVVYPLQVRRWLHVAMAMLRMNVQYMLWMLTVVGGFIKKYSYAMVAFILAENPSLSGKEAILLSRRMMNGHKWELFKLDLSMLGWNVLAYFTLGLSDVFFGSSYRLAVHAEVYAALRAQALEAGLEGAQALNDTYLYAQADAEKLAKAYPEQQEKIVVPKRNYKNGVERFFCETFGVTLWPNDQDIEIERAQMRVLHGRYQAQCASGEAYPLRLSPLKVVEKKLREPLLYSRKYSIFSLVMVFFVFSMVGWLWEVSLHLVSDGCFVNRGMMHGPWLPIYGTGGAMILVALCNARKKPVLEFVLAVVICGFVEYMTAYYIEMTHGGLRWWDYGGYFLNLHGRICAEGLIVFGLGGMAAVYAAGPLIDNLVRRMNRRVLVAICVVLLACFAVDQVYSSAHPNTGAGITSIESEAEAAPVADMETVAEIEGQTP